MHRIQLANKREKEKQIWNKNPVKGATAGQSKGFLPKADHDLNAA
ncbi:MAG: hypothetical protein ACUVXA_18320 [Candidatus Jordarchaeum sp.]